ncbi:galactose ABC transporter substrate-binding protein [Inconstantimicrobium mannanitabidum]|uniref:Galactose ABC transporter substrate-binding protein n=1 Tax=Inconstantimicrobium mannanitabidum TaxID=1604901 RepID=A0ACB5R9J8_9CLOT|nr:galactose ABC transporter substrate-binding protein [Clostridium sp. TW13]GKX65717.1 galactose ABC transporter substrate-binding protein [Clostridium sp. TW13]
MKVLKNIVIKIIIPIFLIATLLSYNVNAVVEGRPVKVGVFLYRLDPFISLVKESLENIQKQNPGKVEFTFFDANNDQTVQNRQIDDLLMKGTDLLLVNLVDTKFTRDVVNKTKESNVPVVFFNREPVSIEAIRSYSKACFVGTDAKQAGILQGQMLIDIWNRNKNIIDRNKDNIMQYVMLQGEKNNLEAIDRTKYSVLTINNAGIPTEEIALQDCDWNKDIAKDVMTALLLRYGDKIEVIISNNDAMAEGAIEALQAQGFNNGNPLKTLPVVGVDAIPSAQELIKKGYMSGSVVQDPQAMAEALYLAGMNLVNGKSAIDGTKYKFDETGVAIRLPYTKYIVK